MINLKAIFKCAIVAAIVAFPTTSFSDDVRQSFQIAQTYGCGGTCGRFGSCREAVYQWCVCGYRRADGDGDGVPCESLCGQSTRSNLDRVRRHMREFGCR